MCGKALCKGILVAFNILFFIIGLISLALGIWAYVDKDSIVSALSKIPDAGQTINDAVDAPSLLQNSAIGLMAVGGVIFLIGALGCIGALKEIRLFLGLYAGIVIIIFIGQIAAGVLAVIFKDDVQDRLKTFLDDNIKTHYTTGVRIVNNALKLPSDALELGWDTAQVTFECCGNTNYSDWTTATKFNRAYSGTFSGKTISVTNAQVPITCCKMVDHTKFPSKLSEISFVDAQMCLTNPNSTYINTQGCYQSVKDLLLKYAKVAIGVGLGIAFIEIVGIIAACYLCKKIKEDDD